MANKDENNKNHTTDQQPGGETGRTHNSQNPAIEQEGGQQDISAVDQQEGTMNHGETGGHGFTGNRHS
jgi:hypothetical protein